MNLQKMPGRPFKMKLPGSVYRRKNRWWWKVRLPGEPRVRDRALRPDGSRFGTKSRKMAEKVAVEMWEGAIRTETEMQMREDLRETMRRKAKQCAKKVAKAKAEAKEKLAQQQVELKQQIQKHYGLSVESNDNRMNLGGIASESDESAESVNNSVLFNEYGMDKAQVRAEAEEELNKVIGEPVRTGTCECCWCGNVLRDELIQIDSGQYLCPECLAELRSCQQ